MFRLYGHGFYYSYTGNNENQTIEFIYHIVDDFGSLVEVARIVKPWEFKR